MKSSPRHPEPSKPDAGESGGRDVPEGAGAAGHEDWLLDESLDETFPASDPIAPARAKPSKPPEPGPR